jgi:serine/threonine-protein kinase
MKISDFKVKNRKRWVATLKDVFPVGIPESARWTSIEDIKQVLSRIGHDNLNHMFFPSGGGLDLTAVRNSHEDGCLDLMTGSVAYVVRPATLFFESFPNCLSESYFRLETGGLKPTGTYPDSESDHEELVGTAPGEFYDRSCWDEQTLGEDEDGSDIPLPPGSRLIIRYFRGAFLFVAKGSMYNSISGTYDARHNKMSASQCRAYVADAIKTNASWIDQIETLMPQT